MTGIVTCSKKVNILNAYTSKYATYLFLLWCCVSADGESMAEESEISQVLGEESSTMLGLVWLFVEVLLCPMGRIPQITQVKSTEGSNKHKGIIFVTREEHWHILQIY